MQQWVPRGRVLDERLVREHPFGGLQTLSSQPGVEEGSEKRPEEESRETGGRKGCRQVRLSDGPDSASCFGTWG